MGRDPKKKKAKEAAKQKEIEEATAIDDDEELSDAEGAEEGAMDVDGPGGPAQVWRPGVDPLNDDEELEFDPTAYDALHPFSLEWPCLSFDILRDELGDGRTAFPHTLYLVAGTQAEKPGDNSIQLLRLTQLSRIQAGGRDSEDSDEDSSDSEDEEEAQVIKPGKPVLQVYSVPHHGGINRIRASPHNPGIVATWGETGHVQVWDLAPQLQAVNSETATKRASKTTVRVAPRQIFTGHTTEGFALDWSRVVPGRLVSGDCAGKIHLWEPQEGGRWAVSSSAFEGHESSVEDLQWSPSEAGVFASCGVDGHIAIWDARSPKPALRVKAHDADVNVMSWNALASCMLVTGCDDGSFRIWDLRTFKEGGFVANFNYHNSHITSVEWSRFDSTTLATASGDNQVAVWDLAVERDPEEEAAAVAEATTALPPPELPPQLMFVHQGQKDVKELHWHAQVPGLCVTTAGDGFNVFKPSNCP